MDTGKSFSYVFEDPGWVGKVLIGGGIGLAGTIFSFLLGIPFLIAVILTTGYWLTVVRNVYDGKPRPLPEWNDFGGFFMKGLFSFIGSLVIFLPAIILDCIGIVFSGSAMNASSSQSAGGALNAVSACLQCLAALYFLVAIVYLNAANTRFALTDRITTFWDFSGNLAFIQRNVGGFIVALIMAIIAGLIGGLGIILLFIPVFFTVFWSQQVAAHIWGQYARTAVGVASTAPPMSPTTPPPMAPTTPA